MFFDHFKKIQAMTKKSPKNFRFSVSVVYRLGVWGAVKNGGIHYEMWKNIHYETWTFFNTSV